MHRAPAEQARPYPPGAALEAKRAVAATPFGTGSRVSMPARKRAQILLQWQESPLSASDRRLFLLYYRYWLNHEACKVNMYTEQSSPASRGQQTVVTRTGWAEGIRSGRRRRRAIGQLTGISGYTGTRENRSGNLVRSERGRPLQRCPVPQDQAKKIQYRNAPARSIVIPVVDLFSGPGGLGEGFASYRNGDRRHYQLAISIEKDRFAHATLQLRAFFRRATGRALADYYRYIQHRGGPKSKDELFERHPATAALARAETAQHPIELGVTDDSTVNRLLGDALDGADEWVLIGGPPCQAYSMAGRSRMGAKRDPIRFDRDKRHLLYREYLRVLERFKPPVFVMENVKGLLTSRHRGERLFERILQDLCELKGAHGYEVYSLTTTSESPQLEDYLVLSEDHGTPQARHRVILLGIREDLHRGNATLIRDPRRYTVEDAISDLPPIRSRLSRHDSYSAWREAVAGFDFGMIMDEAVREVARLQAPLANEGYGGAYVPFDGLGPVDMPAPLREWIMDPHMTGCIQHESRAHMASDLHRYLYAAMYGLAKGVSPRLGDFPAELLPRHRNVASALGTGNFADRFRVQVWHKPSSTVTAHIRKDGHYFIHPDPSQCRSLTVREAARLQTFPDNYHFEGPRTEQHQQVGNAVPPLLANRIAEVIHGVLRGQDSRRDVSCG